MSTKGQSKSLWMQDEDVAKLAAASEATGIPQTDILGYIVRAGLGCVAESGNRITFPIKFRFADEPCEKAAAPVARVAKKAA